MNVVTIDGLRFYELSNKKRKALMGRARMMKARVHLGMNGVRPNFLAAFKRSFWGSCTRPTPSDVIRMKVHPTFRGSIEEVVRVLCEEGECVFVGAEGVFLVFWKPGMEV